jgi:hypothetical protein
VALPEITEIEDLDAKLKGIDPDAVHLIKQCLLIDPN